MQVMFDIFRQAIKHRFYIIYIFSILNRSLTKINNLHIYYPFTNTKFVYMRVLRQFLVSALNFKSYHI